MTEIEPDAEPLNELYVYRQVAGYAAGLDRVPEVTVPTGPRLAPIPELPPQEYAWNLRVKGGGIYDDPPPVAAPGGSSTAVPHVAPTYDAAVAAGVTGHPYAGAPPASSAFVVPAEPGVSPSWRTWAWVAATLAVAEGGVIAYLLAV